MEALTHFVRYLTAVVAWSVLLTGTIAKPREIQPHPRPVEMVSSFYGPGFHGRWTASGTRFDRRALTAAHRTLPFGTRLILTHPKTRKSVTVEITDRGPYSEFNGVRYFKGSRDLDVSEAVARILGFEREGVTTLSVRFVVPVAPEAREHVAVHSHRSQSNSESVGAVRR